MSGGRSTAPRRSWPVRAPRCAATTKRDTTVPADPLDALRLPIVPVEPRPEFAEALLRRIQPLGRPERRATPTIRYFVNDLDTAVDFYCRHLGFEEELRPSPVFAMLYRGDLRLLLSLPIEPHALADGTLPAPGGFNRMSLRVGDLLSTVDELRGRGVTFATPITAGPAVNTVL